MHASYLACLVIVGLRVGEEPLLADGVAGGAVLDQVEHGVALLARPRVHDRRDVLERERRKGGSARQKGDFATEVRPRTVW